MYVSYVFYPFSAPHYIITVKGTVYDMSHSNDKPCDWKSVCLQEGGGQTRFMSKIDKWIPVPCGNHSTALWSMHAVCVFHL